MKLTFEPLLKVSYSRIKSWRRCHMRHHLRYNEGLRKKKKGIPLMLGSAIHECIEFYHEGKDWQMALESFKSEFDRLFAEERAELGDLPTELGRIMHAYFDYYSDDGLVYPKRRWGISTEIPVQVWLDSHTLFIGYIDAYPQDEKGRNWIMDHKSFKTLPDDNARFSDYQFVVYHWLLPQLGYPKADGIIWDYIRKKAPVIPETLKSGELSRAKNQDTTVETYMARAAELFGRKEAEAKYGEFAREAFDGREERFFRRVYLPTPSDTLVSNVVGDLLASVLEIKNYGTVSKTRHMSYDCPQCEFFSLCSAELRGLDTEFMRSVDFEVKGNENDSNEESVAQ